MADVNRNATLTAFHAISMDDPHPKGYVLTASLRIKRIIFAYEWAKEEFQKNPDYPNGYDKMPSKEEVRIAILDWEARSE